VFPDSDRFEHRQELIKVFPFGFKLTDIVLDLAPPPLNLGDPRRVLLSWHIDQIRRLRR